jgi:hypothetical protein
MNAIISETILNISDLKEQIDTNYIPNEFKTYEITIDDNDSKSTMIKYINNCLSYELNDRSITFIMKKSHKDIEVYHKDLEEEINIYLNKLNTPFKSWLLNNIES